jgi:hypothetical protein
MDRLHEVLGLLRGEAGHRRVAPHSARVRPLVAVEQALEVLRRRQRQRVDSVAEGEERDLFALEQLLHDDRLAEDAGAGERVRDLVLRPADEDALAGRQPVRLHDARRLCLGQRAGRRHSGCVHDVLGERLRAFDPRRGGTGAEDGDPRMAEVIGEAGDQRRLRADDDEVDAGLAAQAE